MAKHRIDLQFFAVNSEEYWRNREEENLKNNLKSEEEYDKRLKEIYQNMLDGCQSEINAFYGRYASKENISIAEAKKRVSELDIKAYERKAKRYVKEKDLSKEANEEMRLYNLTMKVNRLEMLKANIGLELIAGHDELNKFMGEILKGRTKAELKRQAGILGKTITNNAQKADAIVNGSFQNATFSQRIWMYQDALRSDLDKLLQSGLIQGKNPRELAKTLRRTFDTTISNAERLMRTELARVQTEAQKQSFQRNGYSMYTYHCIGNDGKTCSTCKGLNGKHFNVEDMLPGTNASPMHPNCRCSCSAYEDSAEYEAWLNHLANGGTTEEYNNQKMQPKTKVKNDAKKLTTTDIRAINDYISAKSYVVNEKLRNGTALSDEELQFTSNLDSALNKMPTFSGEWLTRSLYFDFKEDVNDFLKNYEIGKTVCYNEYISTTKGTIYNPDGQVQIYIANPKNGKDISSINAAEQEVLYKRDSTFKIKNIVERGGKYYILLEEKNE